MRLRAIPYTVALRTCTVIAWRPASGPAPEKAPHCGPSEPCSRNAPEPAPEPSARCPAGCRLRAHCSASGAGLPEARRCSVRAGRLSSDTCTFPTTAIVSLLYVMEDGASAEIAIVGNEGILGIALIHGRGDHAQSRGRAKRRATDYRLRAQLLKEEFGRFGPFLQLLLRYTQALITQMAQTAVCNRHHSVDQQLCRWLLLSLDQAGIQRADHDAGVDRKHAGCTARRRHRGCR